MKTATVTVIVKGHGDQWNEDTLRKLEYTEDVKFDIDVARTLVRAARLIHPKIDAEFKEAT